MIIHDFICIAGHQFQGWFRSTRECHDQHFRGRISCPACGSDRIKRQGEAKPVELEAADSETLVSDNQVASVLESLVSIAKEPVTNKPDADKGWPAAGSSEEVALLRRIGVDIEAAPKHQGVDAKKPH